jgi:hypothetical protein
VLTGNYQDLLTGIAGSAAGLTGLLFVALSVAHLEDTPERPAVVHQVRAAAAILTFTNALAVALFGLVPGNNAGYPAVALAVTGIFFIAAGARSIITHPTMARSHRRRQFVFIVVLLVVFGFELDSGIRLIAGPHDNDAAELLGNLLVVMLLIGIARAWEMVGDRGTGIVESIAVLTGHAPEAARPSKSDELGKPQQPGHPDPDQQ